LNFYMYLKKEGKKKKSTKGARALRRAKPSVNVVFRALL